MADSRQEGDASIDSPRGGQTARLLEAQADDTAINEPIADTGEATARARGEERPQDRPDWRESGWAAGAGRVTDNVRDAGVHTVRSVGAVGAGAVGATRDVLRDTIVATEDVGSGLVHGVAHLAKDIVHGVRDVGAEVRDGASGLIGGVGEVGNSTVQTVTGLLVGMVGGVRQVVGAAVTRPQKTSAPEERRPSQVEMERRRQELVH